MEEKSSPTQSDSAEHRVRTEAGGAQEMSRGGLPTTSLACLIALFLRLTGAPLGPRPRQWWREEVVELKK